MPQSCEIDECHKGVAKRGMCGKHYTRWYRHGDASVLKRATSTPGVTAAVKKQYVVDYKLQHGCIDCGYRAHAAALDFDHLPGCEKVRDIKSGQQLGWQALLDEIAKCEVVCANCHRIRTVNRREED